MLDFALSLPSSLQDLRSARCCFPALVLGFFAVLFFVAPDTVCAQPAVPLHTSGRFIVDLNGARVHLNAFNWYGSESTDYVVEGLQAQPLASIVSTIKGMGFNAVRLLWSNQMVESNPVVGNYALTANPSLDGEHALTIFDTVVNTLTGAGIMVILDNHMSNAGWCCSTTDNNELWYNSQYPQANWIADWQAMAQRYANNPMVIGVDLRNEPRSPATWGGSASTDWHAAAQTGGNAVLAVNPNLLVFVEGISYAGDLSGVTTLPVQLNVANQLVYEAHDYGFWYSKGFTSYSNYVNTIMPKWGYLITGANPQPLWVGEFGTCNSANNCVNSDNATDYGYWFQAMSSYLEQYGVDWSYWAINGTTESGNGGGFNTVEGYGVLNTSWNGSASPALTSRLQSMMATGAAFNLVPDASITLMPGAVAQPNVTIVPAGGFSGTVNLSCSVIAPTGATDLPQCNVPPSVTVSGNTTASATVVITTTGTAARNMPARPVSHGTYGRDMAFALAGTVLLLGGRRRHMNFLAILVLMAGSLAISACACGNCNSNGSGSTPGTTAGSYAVKVTASATGVSPVSTQIGLTIQ